MKNFIVDTANFIYILMMVTYVFVVLGILGMLINFTYGLIVLIISGLCVFIEYKILVYLFSKMTDEERDLF